MKMPIPRLVGIGICLLCYFYSNTNNVNAWQTFDQKL